MAASMQKKIQSPCNVAERSGGGGVVDENVGHRRALAPEWSRSAVELFLCSLGRRQSARGKGAEEEEGTVGGG
jgi:hypothetical protein